MSHEPWSELWELRQINKNLEILIAQNGGTSTNNSELLTILEAIVVKLEKLGE